MIDEPLAYWKSSLAAVVAGVVLFLLVAMYADWTYHEQLRALAIAVSGALVASALLTFLVNSWLQKSNRGS